MESDSGQRNYLISLKQEDVVLWPFMHDTIDDNRALARKLCSGRYTVINDIIVWCGCYI